MTDAKGYERSLGEGLADALVAAPPDVQELVVRLVSPRAVDRLVGLERLLGLAAPPGGPAACAPALPFVLALATARGYPEASALLARLAAILDAVDVPPRSLSGDARVIGAFRGALPALLRAARESRDPAGSRTAACIAARFPEADARAEPLLVALASGVGAGEERARIDEALARIVIARGGTRQRME